MSSETKSMTTVEVLRAARAKIGQPGCRTRGALARTPGKTPCEAADQAACGETRGDGKVIYMSCTSNDGWKDCRIEVDRDDCDTATAEANAARLALCWNSHDDLVKALRQIATDPPVSESPTIESILNRAQRIAREALSSVEKGTEHHA